MTKGVLALLLLLVAACGDGQAADLGTQAALQVKGGTFVRAALPADAGGPTVEAAYLGQTRFPSGFQGKSFSGVLGASATAIAIALEGDAGYWLVPAGPPLIDTPELPSFEAPLSFAAALQGPQQLVLAASDGEARFGPRKSVSLTLSARPLPQGPLVFSLFWDHPSDLDLHVVLPDGTEVDKDNINSWRPNPAETDPEAFLTGGRLDFDSNAQCRIDGRNNENVAWSVQPPVGRYIVRVDTFSLCGETAARWSVEARYLGERVALATGMSLASDTRPTTGAPAGVTAFDLVVR